MSRFAVAVPSRDGTYEEIAVGLDESLRHLGHESDIVCWSNTTPITDRRVIALAVGLPTYEIVLPPGSIIYTAEPLHDDSPWLRILIDPFYRKHEVWDYDAANVEIWRAHGVEAKHVPFGYVPALDRITLGRETIDVLLYGAQCDRRQAIVDDLRQRGVVVEYATDLWGAARDERIASSRIVLNVHAHGPGQRLETARVLFLNMNHRFVVSETSTLRPPGVVFAPYNLLAQTCVEYLGWPASRALVAQIGYRAVRSTPMWQAIEAALR